MNTTYQARWITKERGDMLKRTGRLRDAVLLESFNGLLLVEPVGSNLGDGPVLSSQEADYEISTTWCTGPKPKIVRARELMHLEHEALAGV